MQRRFSLLSLKLMLTVNKLVASFALQDETTATVLEDLSVLKSWNPSWQPKSFMVDNCKDQIVLFVKFL